MSVISVISVTLSVRVRAKVIQVRAFVYCDNSGWQKVGVGDVGPKSHGFTATSTRPKIHLTVENIPKDYFKLFLTENLVQGFVDETNTYANNSIVSKQLSPRSI
jgi:hypothetical protein